MDVDATLQPSLQDPGLLLCMSPGLVRTEAPMPSLGDESAKPRTVGVMSRLLDVGLGCRRLCAAGSRGAVGPCGCCLGSPPTQPRVLRCEGPAGRVLASHMCGPSARPGSEGGPGGPWAPPVASTHCHLVWPWASDLYLCFAGEEPTCCLVFLNTKSLG